MFFSLMPGFLPAALPAINKVAKRKVRYEIMTLDDLIDWLEGQDPNTRYDFSDARTCLITKYENARLNAQRWWWQPKPDDKMRAGSQIPELLLGIASFNATFRGALAAAYKIRTEREMKNVA